MVSQKDRGFYPNDRAMRESAALMGSIDGVEPNFQLFTKCGSTPVLLENLIHQGNLRQMIIDNLSHMIGQ